MNSEYRELLESLDPWIWMPGQPLFNIGVTGPAGNRPYSAGQHPSILFDHGTGRTYSGVPSAIPGETGYFHVLSNLRHSNISGLTDLTAGFTCVAIVNPVEQVNWGRIISFGRAFINSEVILSRYAGTNDLHIGWWNGNASKLALFTTGNRMPLNKEVLVVGMYDPAEGKAKLFIDGERVAEMSIAAPASDTERKIVSFGGHSNNGEQWAGTITMPAVFRRALTDAEVMELARKSTLKPIALSGRVPLTPSAIGGVASVIGTASVGGSKVFQAEVGPDGEWEAVAQDVAVDLSYAGKLAAGQGYLAGGFPDAITRVEGVPAPAEVRVIYRGEQGQLGDGHLVAEQVSGPDGTWLIEGLNPDLKYDVICRHEGYNDMILSNVSPALDAGLGIEGSVA